MIVHLCCAVDAGYFLKRLKQDFDEEIIGFFYDPNIQPYSEYLLRLKDTQRICKKLNIKLIEGDYNYEYWLKKVSGYENEPEKGIRCSICFDISLEETAKLAKNLNHDKISTSLLMSPMKSKEQLANVGKMIKRVYDIEFIIKDYAQKGGHQAQQQMAKENQVYRQDYCGCMFGLINQRDDKPDELYSPITKQILPASIEERLQLYEQRENLEKQKIDYKIVKENFLNYRLLNSKVFIKKTPIIHYTLFYSHLEKEARGRIEYIQNDIYHLNRMQVKFITLKKFNTFLNKNYKTILDIYKNPPTIDEELNIREALLHNRCNLSPIIVLDNIPLDTRIDIQINSKIYPDNKEIIIVDKTFYKFPEFIQDVKILHQKIKPFNPDSLLAVSRGGLSIAHMLGEMLNIRDVCAINSIHYDKDKKLDYFIIKNIPDLSQYKKIVIVDDISDSGETLNEIINIIKNKYPHLNIKTATIFYKPTSIIIPDFTIKEAKNWIVFFWEKEF